MNTARLLRMDPLMVAFDLFECQQPSDAYVSAFGHFPSHQVPGRLGLSKSRTARVPCFVKIADLRGEEQSTGKG